MSSDSKSGLQLRSLIKKSGELEISGCAMEPRGSTCGGNGNHRRFSGRSRCLHGDAKAHRRGR